ncbi:hypothetical protein HAX54_032793, partial [Datura stramonium]|nr:hypothetical protein [Datura stramonium]
AAKLGATTDNVNDNAGRIGPVKKDVGISHHEQNDIVRSRSQAKRQKLANEDVEISDQQNYVAQEKQQN